MLTLGTAPCGLSPKIPPPEIAKIVDTALELGINSIDTAPAYKQSEEAIGMVLGARRKDVFLATKVLADTIEEAEESLSNSFRLLKTDWFDLVYYHSAGDHDVEKAMQPDGVFDWLVKQKEAGKFRFLGISGHNRPDKFVPLLETDEVDVLLTVVNFVDRHTYNFEDKVLPVARKHNTGIVAMKVFGGAREERRLVRESRGTTGTRRGASGPGSPLRVEHAWRLYRQLGCPQQRSTPQERRNGQAVQGTLFRRAGRTGSTRQEARARVGQPLRRRRVGVARKLSVRNTNQVNEYTR